MSSKDDDAVAAKIQHESATSSSSLPTVQSSFSAYPLATQCLLNEAMEFLDPPPNTDAGGDDCSSTLLTTTNIAKAYERLLSALLHPADAGSIRPLRLQDERFNAWTTLQADIYRALLLSAHLLLGMARREEADTIDTSENASDAGTNESSDVILNLEDVDTLKQTQRRCKLLLLELSELIRSRDGTDKDSEKDWHDNILPRSSFQLLRECLELSEAADGAKERLVSLDLLHDENICDLDVNNEDEIDVNGGKIGKKSSNEPPNNQAVAEKNDEDDVSCIGFDRRILEREENELMDIVMPETIEQNGGKSSQKGKKRKRNHKSCNSSTHTNAKIPSPTRTNIAKQGFLVLVNNTDADVSSPTERCFVKLSKSGLLSIQVGGKKADDASIYYLAEGCRCDPRSIGNEFYFFVEGLVDTGSKESSGLIFKVDDETGGGLAEGYGWVTAMTTVAAAALSIRKRQDRIRREWSKDGWEECAQKNLAKESTPLN